MRSRWAALTALLVVSCTAGCGNEGSNSGGDAPSSPSQASTAPSRAASPGPTSEPTTTPAPGDELAQGDLKHTIRTSSLIVEIVYTPADPISTWTPDTPKPVQVQVSVRNQRQPKQKIYLTRASMRFALDDGTGDIAGPDPIVDTANITPGYLVTSPNTYVQSFAIPEIDPATRTLSIAMKLETVSLVDAKAKDYTKQTVTDTVTARMPF